ncbi:MAG: 2-hydroxymuconate tautomerase [Candidatus Micrarchaeia archaeon]
MPVVEVKMHAGRTQEQKDALIAGVTDVLVKTIGCPPEKVHVIIADVEKTNWGGRRQKQALN